MRLIGYVSRFSRIQRKALLCSVIVVGTLVLVQLVFLPSSNKCLTKVRQQSDFSKRDGDYYNFSNEFLRFYAYSAFYDDRPSLLSTPVVRIIAISDVYEEFLNRSTKQIYCILYHDKTDVVVAMVEEPKQIGYGWPLNDIESKEYVYTCPTLKGMVPKAVRITTDQIEYVPSGMPVVLPKKTKLVQDFCVCVQAVYGTIDPYRLIEWMELLKILGVGAVRIYILSAPEVVLRVFRHYSDERFVQLRDVKYVYSNSSYASEFWLHLTPTINDCIYRHMYEFRWIIVTDFDEFIIPRKHRNLAEMMRFLEKQTTDPNFAFRNNYFFLELKSDEILSSHLTFVKYRNRVDPSGVGYAEKSIINPQACVHMHNHCCWGVTRDYEIRGNTASVDAEIALNQHYKRCHFSKYECQEMMKNVTLDNAILPFKEDLIRNVREKAKLIMGDDI